MYKVPRPSETRHRGGKGPAPSQTVSTPTRANPELGPLFGTFFKSGQRKALKKKKEEAAKKEAAKK